MGSEPNNVAAAAAPASGGAGRRRAAPRQSRDREEIEQLRAEVASLRARLAILDTADGHHVTEPPSFLADASQHLASSLDYDTTLQSVARLAVPALCDLALINVLGDDGRIRRLAAAHADPTSEALLSNARGRRPRRRDGLHPVAQVLRTGQAMIVADVSDAFLTTIADSPEHLGAMRELAYGSAMIVPLLARGRTLGAITFMATTSGRRYGPGDLVQAEELARRAALALDNAQLYEQAQAAIRSRDAFIALAAHELRTPLTALKGYAQLLQRRAAYDAKAVATIVERANLLQRLINDLLDASRLQTGRLRLQPARVDLAALARSCLDQTVTRGHELRLEAAADLPRGWWDHDRIEQVFHNLLGNAVKYSPPGSTIWVRLEDLGDEARVSIRDEGVGIPAEVMPRLFDPFYRVAATADAVQGLGLGLYVSKALVEAHGGQLWVDSAGAGQGSTFTSTLPYHTPSDD
jgi:signal transduction histidine kinase